MRVFESSAEGGIQTTGKVTGRDKLSVENFKLWVKCAKGWADR